METVLRAENLSKTFGEGKTALKALDDVTFDIRRGKSVAILGKSGSGKSTLMHQLALLDTPTSGRLFIQGKSSAGMTAKEHEKLRNREFGFVFQQFFLNGNDSVLNNVILPLKVAGLGKRERSARARKALAAVDLEDKADARAADLSGGQKQRACIARALANGPSVIFADEPTGNLDSVTGKKIMDTLFALNKDKGITLIIVTHDQDLADRCQRQIHIRDGRLEETA